MRDFLFIKGIIVGIAKVIPGFSGAVLMISFNLYDRAIFSITNFFCDVKKNFLFLLRFGLGVLIGIVFFSKIVAFFLNYYYLYTAFFFVGLILGGFNCITKNFSKSIGNIISIILSFLIVTLLSFVNVGYNYRVDNSFFSLIIFFLTGIIEAFGMIVPGISSTVLLMLIGIYSYYLNVIGNLLSFSMLMNNLFFLVPFSLGVMIGIIIISLVIRYLFLHYKERTFSIIFGFSLSSVFCLIIRLVPFFTGIMSFVICIFLFLFGYFIARKL